MGLSSAPLSRSSRHAFLLLSPAPTTTTAAATHTTPTQPLPTSYQALSESVPTYAAIGILTSVVLVLLLCVGVAVAVACMTKGKASFQEKTSAIGREKEELNSTRRLKNSFQHSPVIRRTSSTTGFPTQDGRLKVTARGEGGGRRRREGNPESSGANSSNLQKSQSLPSILPPHIAGKSITPLTFAPLTFAREPTKRRANPRGHTRVKKLNIDQTWTAEQLKMNRELSNLQVVQDLVLKRSKYGVNEIKGQQRHAAPKSGPYARYAVRSLAASAKTPEPGSNPVSVL